MVKEFINKLFNRNNKQSEEEKCTITTHRPVSETKKEETKQFKVIITGDGGVGKTSYVNKLGGNNFYRTYIPTMGVNVVSLHTKTSDGEKYILNIWDTAGQEKFGGLRDAYYRGCNGCIILFGLDDKSTYKNVSMWHREIIRVCEDVPIILSGTKSDIINPYKIGVVSNKKNLTFTGTFSSKTGDNIYVPINTLLSGMVGKEVEIISMEVI